MELRHLRYFVAVAEELNITRAARRLNVSQPPLSRQIRDLENDIGTPLLERGARQVRLTAAGKVFFKDARRILELADQAQSRAIQAAEKKAAELRIGYAPSPTMKLMPKTLALFRKTMPQAQVVLLEMCTDEMIDAVAEKSMDLAVLVKPQTFLRREVRFTRMFDIPVGLLVAPSHPFAKRKEVPLAEVVNEPIITYVRRGYSDFHQWLAALLKRFRLQARIIPRADGVVSLMAAVESEQGIAFGLPTVAAMSAGRVRFVPMPVKERTTVEVGHLVRTGKPSELVQAFIRVLETSATGR